MASKPKILEKERFRDINLERIVKSINGSRNYKFIKYNRQPPYNPVLTDSPEKTIDNARFPSRFRLYDGRIIAQFQETRTPLVRFYLGNTKGEFNQEAVKTELTDLFGVFPSGNLIYSKGQDVFYSTIMVNYDRLGEGHSPWSKETYPNVHRIKLIVSPEDILARRD